jgi:hypothetical protein
VRCGEDGTECALRHAAPKLRGRPTKTRRVAGHDVPWEWAATCPCCGGQGKLTLTAKGRSILRHCQKCKASQDDLTAALVKLMPDCFWPAKAARKTAPVIDRERALRLARCQLSATALKVAMLSAVGFSAAEAQAELRIPKSTYYEAMKALGRQSGFPDSAAGHS